VPIVWLLVAGVALAFVCSIVMRNTSGARGTNEPGALAGNLAVMFLLALAVGVAAIAIYGALQ
jgi:hypothetical protein